MLTCISEADRSLYNLSLLTEQLDEKVETVEQPLLSLETPLKTIPTQL